MSKESIAAKLKELRKRTGLTADAVGKMIGKSGKTVSAWESGHSQPDADTLLLLCDIYKVEDILAEFREIENAPSPEEPGEEAISQMLDFIRKGLVVGGFIRDGEDIDPRSAKIMIALIHALFDE